MYIIYIHKKRLETWRALKHLFDRFIYLHIICIHMYTYILHIICIHIYIWYIYMIYDVYTCTHIYIWYVYVRINIYIYIYIYYTTFCQGAGPYMGVSNFTNYEFLQLLISPIKLLIGGWSVISVRVISPLTNFTNY